MNRFNIINNRRKIRMCDFVSDIKIDSVKSISVFYAVFHFARLCSVHNVVI